MKQIETVYKIAKNALNDDQENIINNIKLLAKTLKENGEIEEANLFFDLIGSNKGEVSVSSYNIFDSLKFNILEKYDNNTEIVNFVDPIKDSESTTNFINVLKNKTNRMTKNIKVLIHGRPGTGKTTYLNYIAQKANIRIYHVKASKLISSFIGDTQKNIDLLFEDIKSVYRNSIILIDELDSLLGDRQNVINDEYKRMIGSFCMMIDSLPHGTIFFGITNRINMIDEAILRRFNVKIELDDVSIETFSKAILEKTRFENIELDIKLINKILKVAEQKISNIEKKLTFSIIDDIIVNYQFFNKNIYSSLLGQLIDNSKFKEEDYKKLDFNYLEISKILGIDQRTVKKRVIKGE